MSGSIKNKAVRGAGWSFAENLLSQGVTFIVGLVLARLLSPEEYGLIGIITIFITVFNGIVDSGFSNALIRKVDADDKDYNTVFLTNLLLSIFLFFILFFSAPAIASFFQQPELVSLTRVMGVVVIINAFALIQRTIFVKNIDFKTQTKISLVSSVISGVIGIVMALCGYGVWSLVAQQISRQFLNSLLLWVYSNWFPRLQFSTQSFKDLFGFGWKLLVSGLIDTLWKEIYQVVIGKCYTVVSLGYYTRAKQFAAMFSNNLTAVVQRVSYPVLSEVQQDRELLKRAYKKIIKVTMLATFTCMLGLAAISKSMIVALLGDQWLPVVPFLQIVCLQMMLYPLHAINLNMLQVQGRSDLFLKLEVIKKIIAVVPLLLGVFIGIYWMLWGSVIVGFVSYYLNAFYSGRFLDYSFIEQIKDIFPSFMIALLVSLIMFLVSLIRLPHIIILLLQLLTGFAAILAVCELTKLDAYLEIKSIFISFINKIKHEK